MKYIIKGSPHDVVANVPDSYVVASSSYFSRTITFAFGATPFSHPPAMGWIVPLMFFDKDICSSILNNPWRLIGQKKSRNQSVYHFQSLGKKIHWYSDSRSEILTSNKKRCQCVLRRLTTLTEKKINRKYTGMVWFGLVWFGFMVYQPL